MTLKESPPSRLAYLPLARGWTIVAALACAVATGCGWAKRTPPRPSVDRLMQQAIDRSQELRMLQNEVALCASEEVLLEPSAAGEVLSATYDERVQQAVAEALPPGVDDAPLVNEEFIEADVREAVSILAASVGADVLMDDKVRGVVNVTIENATFDEALEKVLLPLGYVIGRRGAQYVIAPPDPKSPLFPYVSTQVEYRPKHLKAKDLMVAPPLQMASFVRLVEGSNVLIIEAPTQYLDLILARLESLDQPVPQVELEAIICVVSPDCGFRFGVDWDHAVTLDGETAFQLGASGLGVSAKSNPKGYDHLFDDFATTSAFVKLLAQNGYLTIRASPRVMAQDGGDATIAINRETFFSIQPAAASTSNNTNAAFFYQQNIQKVESGISLDITPRIRGDEVTVEIKKAEVSEDIRSSGTDVVSNPYPVITRRIVSTTVHVKDGKTIVIGGLIQRETVDRVSRIPGLSSLPAVGTLFKTIDQQSRDAEVVIFISPRIVRPEVACPLETCATTPDPSDEAPLR